MGKFGEEREPSWGSCHPCGECNLLEESPEEMDAFELTDRKFTNRILFDSSASMVSRPQPKMNSIFSPSLCCISLSHALGFMPWMTPPKSLSVPRRCPDCAGYPPWQFLHTRRGNPPCFLA